MEQTVTKHLREGLLAKAGIPPEDSPRHFDIQVLRQSEWSEEFEHLMRNRLVLGAFRYGKLKAKGKPSWDRVSSIAKRLQAYQETGNTELLIDIANLALLEFEEGEHPKKHFAALDEHSYHVKPVLT